MDKLMKPSFDYEHAIKYKRQAIFFGEQTIDMVELDCGFTEEELSSFNRSFRYGVYILDLIPHIIFEMANLDFQFYINLHEIACENKEQWIDQYRGDASLTLIDPVTLETTRKVIILFHDDFLLHLKCCLRNQLRTFKNEYQITGRAIRQINFLVPKTMKKRGRMYHHP